MSYTFTTSGRLVLPEVAEPLAHDACRAEMLGKAGPLDADIETHTLHDLAAYVGATLIREGDSLLFHTADTQAEWTDQAAAFYVSLRRFVDRGEVHFAGADRAQWSYRYSFGQITRVGAKDGPGTAVRPTPPPAGAADLRGLAPQLFDDAGTDQPQRRPRTALMVMLLVLGVLGIIGIGLLFSGL